MLPALRALLLPVAVRARQPIALRAAGTSPVRHASLWGTASVAQQASRLPAARIGRCTLHRPDSSAALDPRRCASSPLSTIPAASKRVAVVLSGCGVYDGTEVHEASAAMVALARNGAAFATFAPDKPLMHVIDHATGEADGDDERNCLSESSRISRGGTQPLSALKASDFDAIVVPGGFGAAKNLSSFAVDGVDMKVDEELDRVLREFVAARKPLGFCCIAPVIPAKLFGATVTVGSDKDSPEWPYSGTASAIAEMGATHVVCGMDSVCVDDERKIVTAAAFMHEGPFHVIHDNVALMVNKTLELA